MLDLAFVPAPSTYLPEPMYASLGHEIPCGDDWTFEPKYDGMRVIGVATARAARLVTRNGKEKGAQFPEIVAALRELARQARRTLVVDGEIVAQTPRRARGSAPAASEFQRLQSRMHLKRAGEIARLSEEVPATLVIFDLLRDGRASLLSQSWRRRRARLEALADKLGDAALVLGESTARGKSMLGRARRAGWEGIIAKHVEAPYLPGARSTDWLKIKLQFRAEFVVGGFTEPRDSRPYLGALLLGAYDEQGRFVYVGHTGGGFTRNGLREMRRTLERLERKTSPFVTPPRTNERPHWATPKVVVEVKFAEWTVGGLLRQPIFLGVRDDKPARQVTIEGVSAQRWGASEMTNDAA